MSDETPDLRDLSTEELQFLLKNSKPLVPSDYDKDPDRFLKYAKQFVIGAHAVETSETDEPELRVEELYIVWFSKTLQNWKALVSTTRSGDGLYFEVTHNGDKLETYVDTYRKTNNQSFSHHDF